MSEAIDRYVKENEIRFLEELKDFLRIPSISTLPENKEATHRAADFVVDHLLAAGLENVALSRTAPPWHTPTGCTPKASRRSSATGISMSSRPTPWSCGSLRLSSRPSA